MDGRGVTEPMAGELTGLPLADVLAIDELAEEFEAAWRAGENPDAAGFQSRLAASSEAAREALRDHLALLQEEIASDVASARAGAPRPRVVQHDAAAPIEIGEYRLLARLGGGGMGVVYKAVHRRLGRFVAIKFPRFAGELDGESAARFVREVRLLGRLEHPHLAPALDAGDSEYGPYLVTAFLAGETLESLVRRDGPLAPQSAVALTAQAASALGYAHSQGVVHRDVKPSNLFLETDGVLRVLDFGLAKLVGDDTAPGDALTAGRTQTGEFLGTVGYAAPEQIGGGSPVDCRADVYALGCVFYFLLTGEPLHQGRLADRLKRPMKRLPPLGRRRPEVSGQLESLWRSMVAVVPGKRISMAEAETALRQAQQGKLRSAAGFRFPSTRRTTRRMVGVLALGAALAAGWLAFPLPRVEPSSPPPLALAPFNAIEARRHQRGWAMHEGVSERQVNSIGMPLVLIPPGRLHDQRGLPRRTAVTDPFYLGETEVTLSQFCQFVDQTGYVTEAESASGWGMQDGKLVQRAGFSWKNIGELATGDDFPVNNVSWHDAVAFCKWLTSRDGTGTYRLPTETEWEFACRAGTTTTYYFGNNAGELPLYAWVESNSQGHYHPVGLKGANPFGLYDMLGNRREWCQFDRAGDGAVRRDRPIRGGSYAEGLKVVTCAQRRLQPSSELTYAGFRVVCEIR
jgi:serine/threonine protein kinase/formylglycine-generating enzyme required for sulfatase activity